MRKATIFMLFAVMVLGINAIANDKLLKNDNPVGGDILVADECSLCALPLWSAPPEDCDGDWVLLTSDTDYGYTVYDDYSLSGDIEFVTIWYGDLRYQSGWIECHEEPMPVNLYFCPDAGAIPDTANPAVSYSVDLSHAYLCRVGGNYDIYRADIALPSPCALYEGWFGVQGIGDGDSCAFLWYNSAWGNGTNSYQTNVGITEYEQAFCLYSELGTTGLSCDIDIITPYVPSIDGDILFDLSVENLGANSWPAVVGEIFPVIGDCVTGVRYDFDLIRTITTDLGPCGEFLGHYYYTVEDVSGLGLSQVALYIEVGDVYQVFAQGCDEFRFYNPWGRTGGEVVWGDMWYERGTDNIIPNTTSLGDNYPNPFNATTSIPFELSRAGNVSVKIYNLSGQLVETVIDGYYDAGAQSVNWDASSYSSGIYFYALDVGDYAVTKKMNYVK